MIIFEIDPSAAKFSARTTTSVSNAFDYHESQEAAARLDSAIRQFYR